MADANPTPAVAGLRGGSPRLSLPRFRPAARIVERPAAAAEALDGEERAR
ncbi:hypothetical protein [Nonomuraea sp. SBT364]|nr:hypothetical protein [Nonomuraea sp. SBT364]